MSGLFAAATACSEDVFAASGYGPLAASPSWPLTRSDKPGMEHCYGVAKAGKNDCASAGHSCAGQATKDMDKASWLSLPTGVCAKLSGGSTTKM